MGLCPQPVLTAPEAPSPKVLWQTYQGVSGPLALSTCPVHVHMSRFTPSGSPRVSGGLQTPSHTHHINSWS